METLTETNNVQTNNYEPLRRVTQIKTDLIKQPKIGEKLIKSTISTADILNNNTDELLKNTANLLTNNENLIDDANESLRSDSGSENLENNHQLEFNDKNSGEYIIKGYWQKRVERSKDRGMLVARHIGSLCIKMYNKADEKKSQIKDTYQQKKFDYKVKRSNNLSNKLTKVNNRIDQAKNGIGINGNLGLDFVNAVDDSLNKYDKNQDKIDDLERKINNQTNKKMKGSNSRVRRHNALKQAVAKEDIRLARNIYGFREWDEEKESQKKPVALRRAMRQSKRYNMYSRGLYLPNFIREKISTKKLNHINSKYEEALNKKADLDDELTNHHSNIVNYS